MILSSLIAVGCSTEKLTADDDFSSFAALDEKSDAFSRNMKIVGSLDYGATSDAVAYSKTPRYRTFKFSGSEGDQIDVWVRSDDGDAVAWVLDNGWHVLGKNDDADATTFDAHIQVTLGKNASKTHYIVFREYGWAKSHFTVELAGANPMLACHVDADCAAVQAAACCPNGTKVAVAKGQEAAYADANTCTDPPQVCPLAVVLDTRVAECDTFAGQCVMVAPEDIRCGGFSRNPHQCADGFTCQLNRLPDVPGTCVAN